MFEEMMRAVKEVSKPRMLKVDVALDDKGYYDRVCPSAKCGGEFKVHLDDWQEKVPDERAFCPFCGHEAPGDGWDTPEQKEYFESVAEAEMSRLLNDALGRAARRTRPKRIDGGLLGITMSLSYKPGRIPPVIRATATDELEQEFVCEECECRYASLGASFFCPACGHNSAVSCFDNTIATVRKTVGALPTLRASLEESVDADAAKDAVRQIQEDQLPRLVGAFERLNEALFEKLPNASEIPRRGSLFQRLNDASSIWKKATGSGYDAFLSDAELHRLRLLFERRHVVGHRQGIIDEKYVTRSRDTGYQIGQRLVVRDEDVLELASLCERIASGLTALTTRRDGEE